MPFEFTISIETFFDVDNEFLNYTLMPLSNSTDLPEGLIFNSESLVLKGNIEELHNSKSKLLFNPPIELIITGTDLAGKSASQYFKIEVEMSLDYLLIELWTITSLIVTVLGLSKYRDEIHDVFCKKKYQYKNYREVPVGEEYRL